MKIERTKIERPPVEFDVVALVRAFDGSSGYKVVVGDIDGKIHILNETLIFAEETVLESKGTAIQNIKSFPITKLYPVDLLVGDSAGNICLFSNFELLSRQKLSHSISSMEVFDENEGLAKIFAGDRNGEIVIVGGLDLDIITTFRLPSLYSSAIPYEKKIGILKSIEIEDEQGVVCNYIAICDGSPFLHIYTSSALHVRTIPVPAPVNCITTGKFSSKSIQILLGCNNCCLYVVDNLENLSLYATVGYNLSQLLSFSLPAQEKSYVICSGHWNGISIYNDSLCIEQVKTEDWVHTMDIYPIEEGCVLCLGVLNYGILSVHIHQ